MGGTDDKSNLIILTVEEHAEAHKKLFEEHGHWQDYVAWQGLAKLISKEEIVRLIQSYAGKKTRSLYPNPFDGVKIGGNFSINEEHRKLCSDLSRSEQAKYKKKKKYKEIKHQQGELNSQYGKVWCVEKDSVNLSLRKKFDKNSIPENWITTYEWKDSRKNKNNNAYGRHWYNDGVDNFYLYEDDIDIIELGLIMGRLKQRKPN